MNNKQLNNSIIRYLSGKATDKDYNNLKEAGCHANNGYMKILYYDNGNCSIRAKREGNVITVGRYEGGYYNQTIKAGEWSTKKNLVDWSNMVSQKAYCFLDKTYSTKEKRRSVVHFANRDIKDYENIIESAQANIDRYVAQIKEYTDKLDRVRSIKTQITHTSAKDFKDIKAGEYGRFI